MLFGSSQHFLTIPCPEVQNKGEHNTNVLMNTVQPKQPFLTGITSSLPTIRDIATQYKMSGIAGLPNAVRRGDNACYQEIICRSALNKVKGMPFEWTLNPYRGCTHGCHYCFARPTPRTVPLAAATINKVKEIFSASNESWALYTQESLVVTLGEVAAEHVVQWWGEC